MKRIMTIILIVLFLFVPVGAAQAMSVIEILQDLIDKGFIKIEQRGDSLYFTTPERVELEEGVELEDIPQQRVIVMSRDFSNKDIIDMEFDDDGELYLLEQNTIYHLTSDGVESAALNYEITHKSVNGQVILCKADEFRARDLYTDGNDVYLLGGWSNDVSAIFKVNKDLSLTLKYKGVLRNGRSLNINSAGDFLIGDQYGGFIYTHNSGYSYKQYDINEACSSGSYKLGYLRSALSDDAEAFWSDDKLYMFSAGFKFLVSYDPETDTSEQIVDYGSCISSAVTTNGKYFYFNDKCNILKLDKEGNISTYVAGSFLGESNIDEMAINEYGDIAFFDKSKGTIRLVYKGV